MHLDGSSMTETETSLEEQQGTTERISMSTQSEEHQQEEAGTVK